MITAKLQEALNKQVIAEMWSANFYLSISFHFEHEGYSGFASWTKKQSLEETEHAYAIANYIIKRGGAVKIAKIDEVPTVFGTPHEVFEHIYTHECTVSKMIDDLVKIASEERDNASQDFLWGFVREQVEEEATTLNIVEKTKKADVAALLYLDGKLGERI